MTSLLRRSRKDTPRRLRVVRAPDMVTAPSNSLYPNGGSLCRMHQTLITVMFHLEPTSKVRTDSTLSEPRTFSGRRSRHIHRLSAWRSWWETRLSQDRIRSE